MDAQHEKTKALLAFLKSVAALRRRRIPTYGKNDRVLWLHKISKDLPNCRSAFLYDNPAEIPDVWLEVRKKRMPTLPSLPESIKSWVPKEFYDNPEDYIDKDITILIDLLLDKISIPVNNSKENDITEKEVYLQDHPEVQDTWIKYLEEKWGPWVQEMRQWQELQQVYEEVDFMRRRLEEAEERYELIVAVGFLQWQDPNGVTVRRHLLTAPAEISIEAARGILTIGPSASFDVFRVELDMLELQQQPHLESFKTKLEELLEDLDIEAWNRKKVGEVLRVIANHTSPDAQVDEDAMKPHEKVDKVFRVFYAPAFILRERRPTAYDELVNQFYEAAESKKLFITRPWEQFVGEGEANNRLEVVPEDNHEIGNESDRLYFPLPTNYEQRKIAESLKTRPYVLVKGPPGTGKSHTIANLICHLLAHGERVLVTAHAPKALAVLRDLLPGDIKNLCVTSFGSTREDQRLLEESILGIISRKNNWEGSLLVLQKIKELELELSRLEEECAKVDRQLREHREAETHVHTLLGGYHGTAAQIVKQLEDDREIYGWFPEIDDPYKECPLQKVDLEFIAEFHSLLTDSFLKEIRMDVGEFDLPNAEKFREVLENLKRAKNEANDRLKIVDQREFDRFKHSVSSVSDCVLENCKKFLYDLDEELIRANQILGELASIVLKDLLMDQGSKWYSLAKDISSLLEDAELVRKKAKKIRVELPSNMDYLNILADAKRRLEHFQQGGKRGWWIFSSRIIRKTNYIEKYCRVDGKMPNNVKLLDKLIAFLELKRVGNQCSERWPMKISVEEPDPRQIIDNFESMICRLNSLLELFKNQDYKTIALIPLNRRIMLVDADERQKWIDLIEAEISRRHLSLARKPLEIWLENINNLLNNNAHPCMNELARAITEQNFSRWKDAWEKREYIKAQKKKLNQYQELVGQLEQACPILKSLIDSTCGNPEWKQRLIQLDKAWAWSAAWAWIRRVTDNSIYKELNKKRHRLQQKIEEIILKLVELKAWKAFFDRLDGRTEQALIAWQKAIARIGKGTGKYAFKHRRSARNYLISCIPKIPVWVMPLHKLWDTVSAKPGLFNTIIIDEASQAGIESLILLLLGKRIIVVGDDKQNSPEAVGVLEDDIARLIREHLKEFQYREEFRPDTSLYDHAERAFGNVISLREHFRCVPEIIRFSNDLCYTNAPLIPLRQPPPDRLPPLKSTFVAGGSCEGEGQRLINKAEANKIVQTIQKCLGNKAYDGKTMGVIVLQGHAQAELIEKKLAEILEPKVRQERRIRCGVPATFQGDERDIIFLSLVVAPNYSYRALTTLSDQRRFNVAMSRARDQVWLFHSVQLHDLSRDDLRWQLLYFFHNEGYRTKEDYEELERLERAVRELPRQPGQQPSPYESWFEVDVALELIRLGYRVKPQYEVAGYRIDLVIEGASNRLAIECDGDTWHGPERYDYDMNRQRQLERAGWTFVRIRESEFYANRTRAIEQIVEECKRLNIVSVQTALSESADKPVLDELKLNMSYKEIPDLKDLRSGVRIFHSVFGYGVVKVIETVDKGDMYITVNFEEHGDKVLSWKLIQDKIRVLSIN